MVSSGMASIRTRRTSMNTQLPEVLHDAEAEPEGHEVDQVGVEVVAGVGEERRRDEVDERRAEVGPQLLPEERHEAAHASLDRTARTKRSSSVGVSVCTSSNVQPRPTTSAATARCTGSASFARTTKRCPRLAVRDGGIDAEHAGQRRERLRDRRRRPVHADDHPLRTLETRRQGCRRVLRDELARRHDHDAGAERRRFREHVRREQDGPAGEPAQQVPHLHGLHGIEADGRLVEHENGRIAEQRLRQADALSEAFRQLPGQTFRHRLQAAARDDRLDGPPCAPSVEPLHAGHEAQIAPHGEVRIQGHLLGQVADLAPRRHGALRDVDAAHPDTTAGRREEADQARA